MINGFFIMQKDEEILKVSWNTETKIITSEWVSDSRSYHILPCIYPENITYKGMLDWMETRCVPRTRFDLKDVLKNYGLKDYDAFSMCRLNHGVSMVDFVWIKFFNEDLNYDDVKVRP